MPDLMDRIYCSEQIHVPPTFPYIMKLYCKAAIRTQPYDLLKWSAAYFRALANGEEPPVKERVEYPPYDTPFGLTPGYIKVLINQFGKDPTTVITAQTLFKKWSEICLDEFLLIKLIALLGAYTTINWIQFVGVCAGFISKTLTQTMILICELFTEEPEGGMASVPHNFFIDLYMFLAQMECGPLSDEEKAILDGITLEEDVCEIADKIRQGIYDEEEFEGEGMEVFGEEAVEEESESREGESFAGEEGFRKDIGEADVGGDLLIKDTEATLKVEDNQDQSLEKEQKSRETFVSEKSSKDSEEASSKRTAEPSEKSTSEKEGELEVAQMKEVKEEKETGIKVEEPKQVQEEPKQEVRKILLEDLEDSIRAQIEEKLGEEEESVMDEDEREFQELSSPLLGAAARVQKFTPEVIGFKVFKKFLRQEVPGIGPMVEAAQVEKVVNFMDSWAHKQELMVMPRNIRHWMCPPLDKVPTPEP